MLTAKFDPSSFFRTTEHVALHVAAEEIFSLLARTLDLPPAWAALVKRKTGEHHVTPPGGCVDGLNAEDVLFVRTTPIDVSQIVEGVPSHDRFDCRAEVHAAVTLHPERSELASFARTILGSRRVAKAEAITAFLQPAVRSVLAQFAAEQSAAALVDGLVREECETRLRTALEGPCFTAGLTLNPALRVQFRSEALNHARQAESQASRRRAEQAAAQEWQAARRQAHTQHVEHVAEVLDKLRAMSAATPGAAFADLIRTFSEQQRGDVYQALFARDAQTAPTRWIIVASADELLYFDPAALDRPARRVPISGAPGPLRSVQSGRADNGAALFLGAARGVYKLPVEGDEAQVEFVVPGAPAVRGGFNSAAEVDGQLAGSHSELGIWVWDTRLNTPARRLFAEAASGAKAVREVKAHGHDLFCCVDSRILHWNAREPSENPLRVLTGSNYTLTALCPTSSGVYAGNSEGEVLHWPPGNDTRPQCLHRGAGRPVESLWCLSSGGVDRLIYTDTSLHVHSRVLGDNFLCRFDAGGQTIRRVEVAADLLVGVNDTRDRLFVWSNADPDQPAQTVPFYRLAGQSVQDVCLT